MEDIDDIELEDHEQVQINYRNTNNKIDVDVEILPVVVEFWNHGIDTFECCQGQTELLEVEDEDAYPSKYPWIICDAKNKEYIENTYDVTIHKNNHFGLCVYEYVESFMDIDREQDFLFVVFNRLEK